jgi:translation initiation factor 2B subunit (eIF-2B alpha/beta/delta family)
MKKQTPTTLEIGKFYRQQRDKYRTYYIAVLAEQHGYKVGVTVKISKYENYINFDSDIFNEIVHLVEISQDEFSEAKNKVLALLEERLTTKNHQPKYD